MLAAYIIEARREQGTLPPHGIHDQDGGDHRAADAHRARQWRADGRRSAGRLQVRRPSARRHRARRLQFGDVRGTPDDFLLAAEESNGVLVSPQLRDKDAAGGALLLAELCARLRQRGSTPGRVSDRRVPPVWLRRQHRLFTRHGRRGRPRDGRPDHGASCGGTPPQPSTGGGCSAPRITGMKQAFGAIRSETDRSSRNFVRLAYEGDLMISVRPSGTEPKIKIYVERSSLRAELGGRGFRGGATRDGRCRRARSRYAVADQLLRLIDIDLPRPALLLSSLVSLDNRIDFARASYRSWQPRRAPPRLSTKKHSAAGLTNACKGTVRILGTW